MGFSVLPPYGRESCYWLWCRLVFPQEMLCALSLDASQSSHFGAVIILAQSMLFSLDMTLPTSAAMNLSEP